MLSSRLCYNRFMRLTHLSLHNFRNYVRMSVDLPPGLTVLVGDNAQGKTNLLEAIYYLATSRSPQASTDRELVNWLSVEHEPLPYARLVGRVKKGTSDLTVEITLTQRDNGPSQPTERYRKQIKINGVTRRAMDLLGQLNVVLFLPEDIALVSGSPNRRRRYLDATLCQVDAGYCRSLSRYNQIVTQRNALLRDLRERGEDATQLMFWNRRLVELGAHLIKRRQSAILALDELSGPVHSEITQGAERLHLRYVPSVQLDEGETEEEIRQAFQAQLESSLRKETAAGVTLAGPHRDELRFLIDDVDAGIYGSRGQQRTAALSLKLAEVEFMRRSSGEHPVLLLDDVLSELDAHRRRFLADRLDNGPDQAIITTTDLYAIQASLLQRCCVLLVQMGQLHQPVPAPHNDVPGASPEP